MHRPAILVLASLIACTDRPNPTDTAATTGTPGESSGAPTSGPQPTTGTPPTTGTGGTMATPVDTTEPAATTSTSTGSTGDESASAPVSDSDPICATRMLHELAPINVCDPFQQDCLPCEKCNAYADDGGSTWNNNKCVPVPRDPAKVGEPCTAESGGLSGFDDCDHGAMCWNVDEQGQGTCVALCTGDWREPTCADLDKTCALNGEGVLILCLDRCDPLAPDACPNGDVCITHPGDSGFLCVLDLSGDGGQLHGPCMLANACDPGLACTVTAAAEECDPNANGCCEPYCDLTAPDPDSQCPGVGQQCLPFFAPDTALIGDEDVGLCRVPQ